MKKYRVFQNNKPCRYPEHDVDPSWDNCDFDTFDEAFDYMQLWLDGWQCSMNRGEFELNKEYNFNGYGDTIHIAIVDVDEPFREWVWIVGLGIVVTIIVWIRWEYLL